jgi:LmbE family N-acetylglucosaminyl deacetylase
MVTPLGEGRWRELADRARAIDRAELEALAPMLIIVPHPDDETLGCGALIATASDLGLRPRIAYLTDGAGSHSGSPTWSRRRLAGTRKVEALRALDVLGVPVTDVSFLGWPDGAPWAAGSANYRQTMRSLNVMCEALTPRSIWSTWEGEPHGDHVAAAVLADDLAQRLRERPRRLDYIVWGWDRPEIGASLPVRSLACASNSDRRRNALECHRTQMTSLIPDATDAFRVPADLAALTDRPLEIYLEAR